MRTRHVYARENHANLRILSSFVLIRPTIHAYAYIISRTMAISQSHNRRKTLASQTRSEYCTTQDMQTWRVGDKHARHLEFSCFFFLIFVSYYWLLHDTILHLYPQQAHGGHKEPHPQHLRWPVFVRASIWGILKSPWTAASTVARTRCSCSWSQSWTSSQAQRSQTFTSLTMFWAGICSLSARKKSPWARLRTSPRPPLTHALVLVSVASLCNILDFVYYIAKKQITCQMRSYWKYRYQYICHVLEHN